ncbi:MAG: acyltransferase [Candidatus Eisenbacteria sp.]|nr:acyltransferase [Candidatus Eisenbacteria bacterium]
MRVGFLQTVPEFGEKERNLERVAELLEGVSADLLVLPELFSTGYLFTDSKELEALAEPFPGGPTSQFLAEIAARHDIALVAGVLEKEGSRYFNSAVAVEPGGSLEVYQKVHLFREEKRWFVPGTRFKIARLKDVAVGLMICFDWFFPESARVLSLMGAQILCHPSNLVLPHCQRAMVTRCLENRVFAITANRAGMELRGGNHMAFTGASQITSRAGEVLLQGPDEGEGLGVVDIDPQQALDKRLTPENDLFLDRNPECYKILTDVSHGRAVS